MSVVVVKTSSEHFEELRMLSCVFQTETNEDAKREKMTAYEKYNVSYNYIILMQ